MIIKYLEPVQIQCAMLPKSDIKLDFGLNRYDLCSRDYDYIKSKLNAVHTVLLIKFEKFAILSTFGGVYFCKSTQFGFYFLVRIV
ncbi:hypothetical protein TOT_010000548 [Theileria orientalis strain Shintoku]|uniref:Uncharacterized protein n=1 Tax=Theileria orientalis strain Shintoku TaxID=869250 RepID=J4C2Q2_THEOR|nr:hypothetical protein TOT_010000548 [Theileria orientalis strain Shintoku]BAM39086.1 hypothetical protein TOT_010000548 [Theileria orientalis strain Shintoku]|eukprot:XP_009689387.1 hypothetical protein TOT_010000548 [Theileria orientalis strain Shintoku]